MRKSQTNNLGGRGVSPGRRDRTFVAQVSYWDRKDSRLLDLSKDGVDCFELFSIVTVRQASGLMTEMHVHPGSYEVVYCQRGSGLVFRTERQDLPVCAGDFFIVPPNMPHCMNTSPKNLLSYTFQLPVPPEGCSFLGLTLQETKWLVRRFAALKTHVFKGTDNQQFLFRHMFQLYDEEKKGTLRRRVLMRVCALNLLLETLDAAERVPNESCDPGNARVRALTDAIRAHPEVSRTLDAMAAETCLSPAKLSTICRKITGLPPHAFILACRIERAKRELVETDRSVTAISLRLGFSASRHFSTYFRALVGKTPLAWRKSKKTQ